MKKKILVIVLFSLLLGINYACQSNNSGNVTPVSTPTPSPSIAPTPTAISTESPVDTTATTKILKVSEVPAFITQNCAYCHATTPNKDSGRTSPAAGITFDSEEEMIKSYISIKRTVITEKSMPIGKIKITDKDRVTIGKWLDSKTIKASATPTPSPTPSVELKTAQEVITQKCAYCHSTTPNSASGFSKAPMSITFNTEAEMVAKVSMINQATLVNKNMPIGGIKLTDPEKTLVSNWVTEQMAKATPAPTPTPTPSVQDTNVITSTAPATITEKCAYCHATTPNSASGFSSAPMAITFNNEEEMVSNISLINQAAIVNKSMPIGGITLSDTERTSISEWIKSKSATNPVIVKAKTPTELITQKCTYCHSATPDSSSGYTKAPKSIVLDTEQEMTDKHDDIHSVIQKREMPIDNITMTDQERAIVLQWAEKIEDEEKKQSWWYRLTH